MVDGEQQRAVLGGGGAEVHGGPAAPRADLHQGSAGHGGSGIRGGSVQRQALVGGQEARGLLGQRLQGGVQGVTSSESSAGTLNSNESRKKYLATHRMPNAVRLAPFTTRTASLHRAAR